MKRWRELGEVPDSDDESLNSLDNVEVAHDRNNPTSSPKDGEPEEPNETPTEGSNSKPPNNEDIWSIPSSSPELPPSQRPVTPAKTDPKPAENTFLEDEISASYVRVTTPPSLSSSPASLLSKTPSPPPSLTLPRSRPSPLPNTGTPLESEEQLSRQTAIRLERSLRPRKPIQQHPYLLENAQYTKFMKSHGVKPIRLVQASQSAKKRGEDEDSQDQEFQAEESQETSAEGPLRDLESGPTLFDDDEDELALTPSVPKPSSSGRHLRTSSQQTSVEQKDATSISDDEELPPLGRLWPASTKKRQLALKRQRSRQLSSTKRKRTRVLPDSSQGSPQRPTFIPPPNIWDLSSSPIEPHVGQNHSQELGNTTWSPVLERPATPQMSEHRNDTTTSWLTNGAAESPIAIDQDSPSELDDGDLTTSTQSSDSESDAARKTSLRIRGVLPASWLRLDRQPEKPAPRREARRRPQPSPGRMHRRGVALPRRGSPRLSSTAPFMLFSDSDEASDEVPTVFRQIAAEEPVHDEPPTVIIDEDDGASVMEDNSIDWMLPGRKRTAPQDSPRRSKKRKQGGAQNVFRGLPGQSLRQPKVTQALSLSKGAADSTFAKKGSGSRRHRERDRSSRRRKPKAHAATPPPLLSILDVLEPRAPRFVKIAARTVRGKSNLGKSSPTKKVISLATRSDNVDALSALRDWKSGKIRPRFSVGPSRTREKPETGLALREVSNNTIPRHQSRLDAFIAADDGQHSASEEPSSTSKTPPRKRLQAPVPSFQPAQLEADEREDRRRHLNARKRTLDAFFRRKQRFVQLPARDDSDFDSILQGTAADQEQDCIAGPEEALPKASVKEANARSRFRKRRRPQRADLEAAQYVRANDPLPEEFCVSEPQEHHSQDKLKGLGPYGTHYTQHFEVFPLHTGTFFHEKTVIGSGLVRDAVDTGLSDRIRHQKPAAAFSLDGKTLRWGAWDDNTSSEFGILVDWILEQLGSDAPGVESVGRRAIEAADFLVKYILGSLSLPGEPEERAFLSRALDVISNFANRFDSMDWTGLQDSARKAQLQIAVRFSVALLAVHSLSNASGCDLRQSMRAEDLLRKFAAMVIGRLLESGTEDLRNLYGDLQISAARERGIRSDSTLANCWMVIIRVLESAAIPRATFWDVTHSVMLNNGVASTGDVQVFERLWQNMFTLLPLCEFDNSGVLIPGMRYSAPVEGWALPQQLVKSVFQLYRSNPRQPPGFNDYCRALVARCHFLVQEWGWRKCTGIIGTIFDFFGSQNLAHLRNEEANRSPQFLEELDCAPLRSIERVEREDRCFHIFIKMLALTIRRLRELGRLKDIKNLVARTLPNHNRQYLKEDIVYQHDLAALRNHHDLLCTLFWISPPEVRPAIHLVEKLVVPGSAHKEACLINVRAWNQLARFMITSGEGASAFKPLAAWRNNVFDQVLEQYLSAASDIEQQFRDMPSDMPGISKDARDEMVAKNKATALDILLFSAKASLDVLRRAPTLESALYGLSITQLQKVFTGLDFQSPAFDWSFLRVALETLEHFVDRIDKASEEQYSSECSDTADSGRLEEAVLLLNERLTKDFFWMCRTTLALPPEKAPRQHKDQAACAEKTITLAARIAARFIKNRVTQLSSFFSGGKYGLFSDLPKNLSSPERRRLPLFLAVLVKHHVFDFKNLGTSILGLWILSILKPMRFLEYENYLADVLKHHNLPFLSRVTVAVGIPPDYNSNIDFFACALQYMRKVLRESGSAQSRQQRDEFSAILRLGMQKMKDDLALLRTSTTATTRNEHESYIEFVRQAISLIKSHAVGICVVDPFFTRPSADYLPPVQDPHLHAAGIVAYGVRLAERDVTAVPQLFHYLYNTFKIALDNDRLASECRILARAARENRQVASFVLAFMLPAVVAASAEASGCWPLLEVYAVALAEMLDGGRACVPRELGEREDVVSAVGALRAVGGWFSSFAAAEGAGGAPSLLLPQALHVMTLLVGIANVLRPSVVGYVVNNGGGADEEGEEAESTAVIPGLVEVLDQLTELFSGLSSRLDQFVCLPEGVLSEEAASMRAAATLLSGLPSLPRGAAGDGPRRDARVQDFAKTVVLDVKRNWFVTGDRVRAGAGPGRGGDVGGAPPMTQAASSPTGARYTPWDVREVLRKLYSEVRKWEVGMGVERRRKGNKGRQRTVVMDDEFFFLE